MSKNSTMTETSIMHCKNNWGPNSRWIRIALHRPDSSGFQSEGLESRYKWKIIQIHLDCQKNAYYMIFCALSNSNIR